MLQMSREDKSKLEIGSGQRPTPGYLHNDRNAFPDIDIVGNPWEIDLPEGSLEEVLALGVIEHLTYSQVEKTFANVYRLLKPGGEFIFDVPDIPVWCSYVVSHFNGETIPFEIDHVFATLYGWQRWEGDEHKSGWYESKLSSTLELSQFNYWEFGVEGFLKRGHERNRMKRPQDAHIYCIARK
jgi:predicted SAM-dependent methyltransferase